LFDPLHLHPVVLAYFIISTTKRKKRTNFEGEKATKKQNPANPKRPYFDFFTPKRYINPNGNKKLI
jgi:hypothetical protein